MVRMNRKVEYALMALKIMSSKKANELTSAKEIVEGTGCPFDATARVLQKMAHHGILQSEQGASGGYRLVRELPGLSLYELMELILGPIAASKCLQGPNPCDLAEKCNILTPMSVLNQKFQEFYKDVSVGELLRVGL